MSNTPMFFTALIVDLFIIAIVALFIWLSARRGFMLALISLCGCIVSVVLAFTLASFCADAIYTSVIQPKIIESVDSSVSEKSDGNVEKAVNDVWEATPGFVTAFANNNGVTKDKLKTTISSAVENGTQGIGQVVSDSIIKPVTTSVITFVLSFVLFSLLMILVRFIAHKLNDVCNLPVLKTFNATLGGVLGFIKGAIIIFVAVMLISLLMPLFSNKLWIFTPELIDNTHLFRLLYNLSPFGV